MMGALHLALVIAVSTQATAIGGAHRTRRQETGAATMRLAVGAAAVYDLSRSYHPPPSLPRLGGGVRAVRPPDALLGGGVRAVPLPDAYPRVGPPASPRRPRSDVRQDEWLGSDKLRHFLLSMAVTQFTYGGLRTASTNDDVALPIAIGVAAVASVGKEVHDVRNDGPFSLKDLAWDAAGIAIAGVLLGSVR